MNEPEAHLMAVVVDHTTAMMINGLAKHQADRPTDPLDDDYLNVEHLCQRMDDWQRQDNAWRILIGARLVNSALEQGMKLVKDD